MNSLNNAGYEANPFNEHMPKGSGCKAVGKTEEEEPVKDFRDFLATDKEASPLFTRPMSVEERQREIRDQGHKETLASTG